MWPQVIHGLLDRVMQLLDVPFSAKKDKTGYYIKAADGQWSKEKSLQNVVIKYNGRGSGSK